MIAIVINVKERAAKMASPTTIGERKFGTALRG